MEVSLLHIHVNLVFNSADVHIGTCIEGDVRLSSSVGYDRFAEFVSGEVQVCLNDVFGGVCDSSWDNQDASVVCRQLGLSPYGKVSLLGVTLVSMEYLL